jgi:hypothetical protein
MGADLACLPGQASGFFHRQIDRLIMRQHRGIALRDGAAKQQKNNPQNNPLF